MAKAKKRKSAKKAKKTVRKKKAVKSLARRTAKKAKRGAKKAKRAVKRPAKAAKVARKAKKRPAAKKTRKTKDVIGEGNYTAAREFRKDEEDFVRANRSRIPEMGKEAERSLEGPEGDELRAAEDEARSHVHE